jgi:hypothetical protein
MGGVRVEPIWLIAAAIVLAAAVARFARLDLMEFKTDEANACRLALHALGYREPGVGRFFPTAGIQASIGIPNPPLFVYLDAIPLTFVRSPLAVAATIAAANVVAVALCYVAGRRIYSRFVALTSAALFAVSPWSIVFARKIWAQDLLPLVTTLFILELHALVVRRRERAVATLILLAAAGTALHYSAFVLVVVAGVALVAVRDVVTWRAVGIATAGTALVYVPFLVLHAGDLGHAHSPSAPPALIHRFANTVHLTAEITAADGLRTLVGSQPGFARPVALVLGAAAIAGLLLGCRRIQGRGDRLLRVLFVIWFMLPATLLTAVATTAYVHYFIVLLPLPFFGIALSAERLAQRNHVAAAAAIVLLLAYFVGNDLWLFRSVTRHGGAAGDYGIAYRYKLDAAKALARLGRGHKIVVGGDAGSEYRLLLWNLDLSAPAARKPVRRYVMTNLLAPHRTRPWRVVAREGPLVISARPSR